MQQFNATTPVFSDGTILITQHRGNDRVLFEVNSGKMVSISVEPNDNLSPIDDLLDGMFEDYDYAWGLAEGNC
jgi:hypothetical protein